MCSSTPKTTPKLSAKTGGETKLLEFFQTKVFRALKQCVSERVPSWSSRCCSSRPTGCCGVAILWICAPIDLPKPRRQPFCVQVRHLSLSSSCSCRQDKSLDFLWCGQEDQEAAFDVVTKPFVSFEGTGAFVRMKCAIPLEATGFRRKARGKQEQRRPLCRGLLRDGGEFDFPLVCMLV